MVSNASALGRDGAYEWLLIRASAILIFLYIVYLLSFILLTDNLTYEVWSVFFTTTVTKVFTLLSLLSVLVHTWIGMWQVLTDYIKSMVARLLLQLIVIIVLMVYLLYGVVIVWGLGR